MDQLVTERFSSYFSGLRFFASSEEAAQISNIRYEAFVSEENVFSLQFKTAIIDKYWTIWEGSTMGGERIFCCVVDHEFNFAMLSCSDTWT